MKQKQKQMTRQKQKQKQAVNKPVNDAAEWFNDIYSDEVFKKTEMELYLDELLKSCRSRLEKVVSTSADRQDNNYDCVIAITGFEGVGKSSLAEEMGEGISKKHGLSFTMQDNIIFHQEGADQYEMVKSRVLNLPEKSALIIDEAIKTMYSRNWNKKEQKDLNVIFTTIRERKLFVALCIPALSELDSFFKNFRVLYWIHIFARGKAGIFVKDPNPFNTDPFNTKQAKRIIDENVRREEKFDVDSLILALHEHIPNFITWFNYKPMSTEKEAEYRKLKNLYNVEMAKTNATIKEQFDKLQEDTIVQLFESNSKWTKKKLAEKFGKSERAVGKIINKARGIKETEEEAAEEKKQEEDKNGLDVKA